MEVSTRRALPTGSLDLPLFSISPPCVKNGHPHAPARGFAPWLTRFIQPCLIDRMGTAGMTAGSGGEGGFAARCAAAPTKVGSPSPAAPGLPRVPEPVQPGGRRALRNAPPGSVGGDAVRALEKLLMQPVEPARKRRDAREGEYRPQSPAGVRPHGERGEGADDDLQDRAPDPADGQGNEEQQREPRCRTAPALNPAGPGRPPRLPPRKRRRERHPVMPRAARRAPPRPLRNRNLTRFARLWRAMPAPAGRTLMIGSSCTPSPVMKKTRPSPWHGAESSPLVSRSRAMPTGSRRSLPTPRGPGKRRAPVATGNPLRRQP